MLIKRFALSLSLLLCLGFITISASAQERLCDTSFEDCRAPLWNLIDNEQVGLDVAFWFMQDTSMSNKIIARHNAGVRVRILVDPRANPTYAGNEAILNQLRNAGIPMRFKVGGGILHWKMMLFEGQNKVEFSGANYGPFFFVPAVPYQDYIDEAIYFTDDPAVVNSFKTKYDDLWTDTANYANYGNVTGTPTRHYATFPIDPAMNFPPSADGTEDFYNRTAFYMNQENQKIDIIMYRHTNDRYTARTVEARQRGVPVRMITEQQEYRNLARQWDAYNIDLLWNAGVQIRIRNHQGLNHEKAVLLYGQGMTIFGSSNWTGPSSNSQAEHNYFTTKPWFFNWFVNHFDRKWNSTETQPFTPLPPDQPTLISPGNGAAGQPTTGMVLTFEGGPWAHKFDIYFGTDPTPPLIATDQFLGRVDDGVIERYTLAQTLTPGTTYYWRIVSKTMANVTETGPTWRFTTAGTPPNPGPAPTVSSITPNSGPTGGGTSVTITGANFQSGATVRIGGTSATSVNVA
ncbi:MAG TPA: phospholipase D-like domain-containing protein, partial [Blastocatellia bacterium]|nr:phospholipase D-like domain-containing protein [Blastocatellia bacterium]